MQKNERQPLSVFSDFHIDIDRCARGMALTVYGARCVLDFNESECLLRVRGSKIQIAGGNLSISVYENNSIEISGKIERVSFL